MKIVCTDAGAQARHAPVEEFSGQELSPYPECPERYDVIFAALGRTGWADFTPPGAGAIDDALACVHDSAYLQFLQNVHASWTAAGGSGDLVASVFSGRDGRAPVDPVRALGYWGFDTTPISAGTWTAALAAAMAARTAADLVVDGAQASYALCRPPGHHASRGQFGGYCYVNHAALAADRLCQQGSVAVIDIDYHHGNGTQEIFYERGDVMFVSLHADPAWEYPLYWGHADETGAGAGLGATINVPLPAGTDDHRYLDCLHRTLDHVRTFNPKYVVVSAGFDTWNNDPLGTFRLSLEGIAAVAEALVGLQRPTVIVQEGGYDLAALGELAVAFLQPFDPSNTTGSAR